MNYLADGKLENSKGDAGLRNGFYRSAVIEAHRHIVASKDKA